MSWIISSCLDLVATIAVLKFQEIHLGSYEDWWLKQRWLVQEIERELHLLSIAGYPQDGCVAFCRRAEKRDLCKKNTNQVKQQEKTSHGFGLFWRVWSSTVDPWSMPNIPLPSSRYCPFGEVSCKITSHIMPCHPFCLHTWAEGWWAINQCPGNCNMSQPWFNDFLSPAEQVYSIIQYSIVFSCILLDVEQRQRKQLKKFSQSLQPCCARSDCTDKKCLCSNSVSGFSQFLGSKRAVSASPYTAPEPGMTWHTQGTPATIGENDPRVQGSHEKNSSTLKCPSQNIRNISSETYSSHVPTGYDYTSRSAPYLLHLV